MIIALGSGKNSLELSYSIFTFIIIANLFLIKQPVIFFTLSYHAAQATIKVFYAEYNNIALNSLTNYSADSDLAEALRLSCIGIIVLSCCIYFFVPKEVKTVPLRFNTKKLFFLYLGFLLVETVAAKIGQFGGLFQIMYKLSVLKWGVLLFMIYDGLTKKKIYFLLIIGFEILIGMFSYFSTFKSVLFATIISLIILNFHYLKIKTSYFLLFGGLSVVLMFTWQNIKEDYRDFLSGGEKGQSVTVYFGDAYDKIIDLATESSYNSAKLIDKTIDRISYIDFFAESLNYIPNERPHTKGLLWKESLQHIVQPRLFFPNKKAIDDSQKTMEYTGLLLAGSEQGTSISLGYIAESYVDFGIYFFIIPIMLLGLLIGWLFKKLYESGIDTLYYWAFTIPFYFQFYGLEMASEKALGSIITYTLVVFIIIYFFRKHLKWLEN